MNLVPLTLTGIRTGCSRLFSLFCFFSGGVDFADSWALAAVLLEASGVGMVNSWLLAAVLPEASVLADGDGVLSADDPKVAFEARIK